MNKKYFLTVILLILSLLAMSACGQGAETENPSSGSGKSNANEPNDSEVVDNEEMPIQVDDIWKKMDLNAPTGNWFMHNGKGIFGYTLPYGTQKAGVELEIGLYGHSTASDKLERTVRLELIETTAELEKIDLIFQEEEYVDEITGNHTIFTITIPEKENAYYVFSLEIVNDTGEIEDTILSAIKVPAYELNASLSTEVNGEELTLIIENDGPTDLFFGKYYRLEKEENGSWQEVILEEAFIDIGIILEANKSYEEKINIAPLKKGAYRIFKDVSAEGLDLRETLSSQFEID